MTISRDQIAGLVFLVFSLAYGFYATDIALLPGEEFEPINARTMPYVLSGLGAALSFFFVLASWRSAGTLKPLKLGLMAWPPVIALLVVMVIYGLILNWLGFVVSTALFLIAGFRIMGERRPKILFGVSIPFVAISWFCLTQLLDIYLAPGRLFSLLGG
ncbi:tripartite tricarboxylate transporter TctB family protein [Hahella ganghwensis]|uniref:tripartite tricarboxylate transporter TctB family protein n=1 Tax=Hahella ganghwensis TaxID=286420 RepID=UPI0003693E01|nr:tripartite tricarboxylate transporter TctB family protein [Hahella ganghwensis]